MFGRHFLSLTEFSREDMLEILRVAQTLKTKQKNGVEHAILKGKTLAMVFQKPSNRTRMSFEVGMYQLGGHPLVIKPEEIQMGARESIADVARVMSRYVDAVMMRVLRHTDIEEFARHSSVPVINGLSDLYHPCQAVSDMLTIAEHRSRLEGTRLCYIGDGNNVCNSLINLAKLLDFEMIVSCPKGYEPTLSKKDAPYSIIRNPMEAARGAHVLYTDVWTSMGQESEGLARLRDFEGYTINKKMLQEAAPDAIFMHCLPAHRGEEVEDSVFESSASVVFDQAENRLHAQKAVLLLLMHKQGIV